MSRVPAVVRDPSTVERLLEIQRFDQIPRTGYLQRGIAPAENVCAHSWQVAFLVAELAPQIDGLDLALALRLALLHDLAELRTGDLPRPVARHLPEGAKAQMEAAVLDALLGRDPVAAHRESREAQLVKACDQLQLALKAESYWRSGWRSVGDLRARRLSPEVDRFEPVAEIYRQLIALTEADGAA